MKILHINCNYTGNQLHKLMVEKLDNLGYDNKVYAATAEKDKAEKEYNANAVVSLCLNRFDRFWFGHKQRKIIRDMTSKIDVSDFDCIHAYTLFTDGNAARKLSKKHNIPYVVAVRNTDVNSFFKILVHLRGLGVKIMRDAEAVFFLSESYRKTVFDKYIPKKYHSELLLKTRIIPNGIDDFWLDNAFEEIKSIKKNEPVKLMFAGRLDKNKNIPTVQGAMKILRSKGIETTLTVVAGKIENKAELALIKRDDYTKHIPGLDKGGLIQEYRKHDIFVMPSFTESFGLVYVEAMSQGLPVLYSAKQGFDGQFPDGEVGYSVDPHSPESVAEGILKIIEDYSSISSRVPSKARKFRWSGIIKEYSNIYEKMEAQSSV